MPISPVHHALVRSLSWPTANAPASAAAMASATFFTQSGTVPPEALNVLLTSTLTMIHTRSGWSDGSTMTGLRHVLSNEGEPGGPGSGGSRSAPVWISEPTPKDAVPKLWPPTMHAEIAISSSSWSLSRWLSMWM